MPSLREQAASGVRWMSASTAVVTALQFIRLVILANLLTPEDFGLMAMVLVVVGLATAFGDVGLSNAIIYRQDSTKEQLSSLYWLDIATGFILFGLIVLITPIVVLFYREPRLNNLIYITSISFIILPIGQQFKSLLQKELNFRPLALIQVIGAIVYTIVATIAAVMGAGVYAFIWGFLADSIIRSTVYALIGWIRWRPMLHFKRDDLKGYVSFGMYQMGERSINYFVANIDYLVIGRFLGPEILGIYMLAYRLVIMPLTTINPIINRVAFPVFAKKQTDNEALGRGYIEICRLLAFTVIPILTGMAITAPLYIPLIFGNEWIPSILIIQILSMVGILKSMSNISGSIFLAKGRADIGFKWNLLVLVINSFMFWYMVKYGVYAVAWTYFILSCIYFVIMLWIVRMIIKLRIIDYMQSLAMPVIVSLILAVVLYGAYLLMNNLNITELPQLIGLIFLGIFIYICLLMFFERDYVKEYIKLLLRGKV